MRYPSRGQLNVGTGDTEITDADLVVVVVVVVSVEEDEMTVTLRVVELDEDVLLELVLLDNKVVDDDVELLVTRVVKSVVDDLLVVLLVALDDVLGLNDGELEELGRLVVDSGLEDELEGRVTEEPTGELKDGLEDELGEELVDDCTDVLDTSRLDERIVVDDIVELDRLFETKLEVEPVDELAEELVEKSKVVLELEPTIELIDELDREVAAWLELKLDDELNNELLLELVAILELLLLNDELTKDSVEELGTEFVVEPEVVLRMDEACVEAAGEVGNRMPVEPLEEAPSEADTVVESVDTDSVELKEPEEAAEDVNEEVDGIALLELPIKVGEDDVDSKGVRELEKVTSEDEITSETIELLSVVVVLEDKDDALKRLVNSEVDPESSLVSVVLPSAVVMPDMVNEESKMAVELVVVKEDDGVMRREADDGDISNVETSRLLDVFPSLELGEVGVGEEEI